MNPVARSAEPPFVSAPDPSAPLVSVIVRSYKRPKALIELVKRLRKQRYPACEFVIIEQSDDRQIEAELAATGDPRLRIFPRAPLGAPGARNEAVRMSRGDILLFIDDDDLPIGDDWVRQHVVNYADPSCAGVSGKLASSPFGRRPPPFPRLVWSLAMKHTFLKDPRTFAFGSLRKQDIDFVMGSNSSLRRSVIDRVGGWDEGVPMGEEQSFAFRFARGKRDGEHLVYDPEPVIWRRVDIAGGLDRRSGPDWYRRDLVGRVIYYHGVVGHYFPWRFRLLYPLYPIRILQQVIVWIWDHDNRAHTWRDKLVASLRVCAELPATLWRHGWRRGADEIRRVGSPG